MGALDKLETNLDNSLNKKSPYQLPKNGREALVKWFPIIALVAGALQLFAALSFWRLGQNVDKLVDYTNAIGRAYGAPGDVAGLGLFFYLSLVVLLIDGIILLLAYPGLKARLKSGWNLMFYSLLVNALYGVLRLFTDVGSGAGSLFGALLGTVLGAYLLFQVRSYYGAAKTTTTPKTVK